MDLKTLADNMTEVLKKHGGKDVYTDPDGLEVLYDYMAAINLRLDLRAKDVNEGVEKLKEEICVLHGRLGAMQAKHNKLKQRLYPIRLLELSIRTDTLLANLGFKSLLTVSYYTESFFLRTPNFGRKSLNELKSVMEEFDLTFGDLCPDYPRIDNFNAEDYAENA
jgi:DNA-directed RNA polymerase alpha subunit